MRQPLAVYQTLVSSAHRSDQAFSSAGPGKRGAPRTVASAMVRLHRETSEGICNHTVTSDRLTFSDIWGLNPGPCTYPRPSKHPSGQLQLDHQELHHSVNRYLSWNQAITREGELCCTVTESPPCGPPCDEIGNRPIAPGQSPPVRSPLVLVTPVKRPPPDEMPYAVRSPPRSNAPPHAQNCFFVYLA